MQKTGWIIVAASLCLGVTALSTATQEPGKTERPAPKGDAFRGLPALSTKALADQIAQLKQEQKTAINELEEIKKLASEEKATKTLGALDKLIARRNQEFQQKVDPLQKRLDALERPKPDQPKGVGTAPQKSGS